MDNESGKRSGDNKPFVAAERNGRIRVSAIDALRGLVILLMALDHSRDFFGDVRIQPEAIETTTVPLFFTRWVTHLCAPTFVFLAGVSAWLHGEKLQDRKQLAWILVTRGVWLIVLEFTVIRFGLMFSLTLGPGLFIVIAAIGASMVLLGLCCFLPRNAVLLAGLVIVAGHNLLDGILADQLGAWGWLWTLFLRPGYVSELHVLVGYPILPWFGVMAIGFGLGPMFQKPARTRRWMILALSVSMVLLFIVLRCFNGYGESQKWSLQYEPKPAANLFQSFFQADDPADGELDRAKTVFSFLKTSKYPPSLQFVLMTVGLSLSIFVILDWLGEKNWLVLFLKVPGGVPLFFFVMHFYLLHLGAWALYWTQKGVLISPMHIDVVPEVPPEYGFNGPGWLVQVYIGWVVVIAILYPLCVWYGARKKSGKSRIWSYL